MNCHIPRQLLFLVLVLVFATPGAGHHSFISDCPTLTIECPTDLPESGKTYTVKLRVGGGNPNQKLTYKWAVSNGEIVDGQGTCSVKIRISDLSKGITATVEVGGMRTDCGNVASCSFVVS